MFKSVILAAGDTLVTIIVGVACLIVGVALGIVAFYFYSKKRLESANKSSEKLISEATLKSEKILNDAKKEGKDIVDALRRNAEVDINEKKSQLRESEEKLSQKEDSLEKREQQLSNREDQLENKREELNQRIEALNIKDKELQTKIDSIIVELQKVASLTMEEARKQIMKRVEEKEMKRIALYKEQVEEEAASKAEEKARTLLANACEKYAQDVANARLTSNVSLPSDEMKGRIIGREGRNIKSMESLFGVSLIIDDTPEIITVSCFDPIRREKARLTLEALIRDGRIQPGRIEDIYNKVSNELDEKLRKIGEQTVYKLGISRINPGLLPYIGRLKYRTSYGQNVLDHSIQVAYLSGVMAAELNQDVFLAKRAGLLHDIGKAIDAEQEGSHVSLGADLAKKYGEGEVVINAIESHHGDVPKKHIISELVTAADTLSAARPGARSETLETYIKRLEQLEAICRNYPGVQSSYALQSGRDLRIMVLPDKISDEDAKAIAIQIRDQIEEEMQYPGQIKVSVIRETRAVEIAK